MLSKFSFLLLLAVLTGCASVAPPAPQINEAVEAQETKPNTSAEALSGGRGVTVNTSQGSISVAPAVVAVSEVSPNAATIKAREYDDPWESFNRSVFSFNNTAYEYVLIPVSDGYKAVVPGPARRSVGNFFSNLREPLNFLNNVFSGEVKSAGSNLGRFLINSTIGLL